MPVLTVAQLQTFLVEAFPGAPPSYVVEDVFDRGARLRLPVTDAHGRPGGTVAGPALMGLADCTAYLAIAGQIGPVALAVTTSLHIDFLRRPELVDVVATGTLLKLGRRLAVVGVGLCSVGRDDLVASAQLTYSIPPG